MASLISSIGTLKCPHCRQGDMYPTRTFSFKKSFEMHKNCPHCGQKFELEPGFYYGAMFISYLLTAFLMFSMFAIFKFLIKLDVLTSFVVATVVIFTLFVWLFRVSRTIWLTFFVRYDPQKG